MIFGYGPVEGGDDLSSSSLTIPVSESDQPIALVLIQPLFSQPNLDTLQVIALTFFAVGLPSVGGYAFIVYNALGAKVDPFKYKGNVFLSLQYTGLVTDLLGITLLIWNTSWIAGVAFLVACLIVLLICGKALMRINEINKEVYKKKVIPLIQQ